MNNVSRPVVLDSFLERWPIDRIERMILSEYVDVGNRDTFCQWVETKTRVLGSIKGGSSYKFGIFKRKRMLEAGQAGGYFDDGEYTWRQRYGNTRDEAFSNVKREILDVVSLATSGEFARIDGISLPHMFKWKIAFLYSNERLIPIYEKETLNNIAEHYGLEQWKPEISAIQQLMIENKPVELDTYEYMEWLWYQFNSKGIGASKEMAAPQASEMIPTDRNPRKRSPASRLNTNSQLRSVARSYVVEGKHNKLQKALYDKLVEEFGHDNVILEEDFVDIKVFQPERIILYEVKSSPFASACIREALGQVLFYSMQIDDAREKGLVVVGQYPPNKLEERFIAKLQDSLKIAFSYEHVGLV